MNRLRAFICFFQCARPAKSGRYISINSRKASARPHLLGSSMITLRIPLRIIAVASGNEIRDPDGIRCAKENMRAVMPQGIKNTNFAELITIGIDQFINPASHRLSACRQVFTQRTLDGCIHAIGLGERRNNAACHAMQIRPRCIGRDNNDALIRS